ncbi:MAG: glycosyltransferase, partial [Muribaculum sp.]|nr:glycosyltransferase [Muribaculum sp.]
MSKILHIGKFYPPIEGGIESINKFIVDSLKGHSQRVISFNNKNISKEEDVDGTPVIRTSSKITIASQPISFKYFRELRRNITMFSPDIIHFHYPNPLGALYLVLLKNKKNKLIVHWHSDVVEQRYLYRLVRPFEQRLLKMADKVITTSPNYRDHSIPLSYFKDKTIVIPCSIDESKFDLKNEDEHKKVNDIKEKYNGKPIVFFIGRHVEYKGLRYLLEAERLIKNDCVFVIAGQGSLTQELKESYPSNRIHWLGRLSDEDMKLYYHAADIFAFPSITKNEAFGVVLAESMYCACPAVTFTIEKSGVNWVSVNNETCIEVANRDIKEYADAIDRL